MELNMLNTDIRAFAECVNFTLNKEDMANKYIADTLLSHKNITKESEYTPDEDVEDPFYVITDKVIKGKIDIYGEAKRLKFLVNASVSEGFSILELESPDRNMLDRFEKILGEMDIDSKATRFRIIINFAPKGVNKSSHNNEIFKWLSYHTHLKQEMASRGASCMLISKDMEKRQATRVDINEAEENGVKFVRFEFTWTGTWPSRVITPSSLDEEYIQSTMKEHLHFDDVSFQDYFYDQLNRALVI